MQFLPYAGHVASWISGHRIVTPCDVLVGLARACVADKDDAIAASAAVRALRASGLDSSALLWYLAHGTTATGREASLGWFVRRRLRWRLTPGMHHVIMHNDDYTSRDFVVYVLHHHFALDEPTAQQLMQKVHRAGCASVAMLPLLQATAQIGETMRYAREQKFPFRLSLYPASDVALAIARDVE